MISTTNPDVIWQNYQQITNTINERYKNSRRTDSSVQEALCRLGIFIRDRYKLDKGKYPILFNRNIKLKQDIEIDLSTIEKMLEARFEEWEEGIPSVKVGHDTWTDGLEAGYYQKKSLAETLDIPFYEIEYIKNLTPENILAIFERLRGFVRNEQLRLESKNSQEKSAEITQAMHLLAGALAFKYNIDVAEAAILSREQQMIVLSAELYSYNTMLVLKIGKWSLHQALNLSTDSLLSKIFGLSEAMWGQTTALENVVKML